MDRDNIVSRLRGVDMLPTFPSIVADVLSIIEDPMSSASDLAKHMDPSMVGEVLRIANSAYFGTRNFRNISTVEHAIAVVGFQNLSYLVLQMPFLGMVKPADTNFDKGQFVRHSILCGVSSKALSVATGKGDPNEIYLSGILHDVGSVVMYRYFREEWDEVLSVIKEKELPRVEAETEVFGVDHGFIGAALLELWNIPASITDAVMHHHTPQEAVLFPQNAMVLSAGNIFSKTVDLAADLDEFDTFMTKYRSVVGELTAMPTGLDPSAEIELLEKIYNLLNDVKEYAQAVEGEHG
jgi:HD-like signal output (HDOD) protein